MGIFDKIEGAIDKFAGTGAKYPPQQQGGYGSGPPMQQSYGQQQGGFGMQPQGGYAMQQQGGPWPPMGPGGMQYPTQFGSQVPPGMQMQQQAPSGPGDQPWQMQQAGFSHNQAAMLAGQRPQGRKKALSIGINYIGSSSSLNGCINDSNCMIHLLKTKFGFQDHEILRMTDDQPDPLRIPTRYNIIEGIRWLMSGLQPGDSLIFHYSGHGSQQHDPLGEERDGMNDTLCPVDFKQVGMIIDDELNVLMCNPLPPGGTVLDMPYICKFQQGQVNWVAEPRTRAYKGTAGGLAVQFSACTDEQTAADTNQLSGNVSTGAATFSFIQAIEQCGPHVPYGMLLHQMHRTLKSMNKGSGGGGGGGMGMLSGLMSHGMSVDGMLVSLAQTAMGGGGGWSKQTPCMSSNEPFDLNMPLNIN